MKLLLVLTFISLTYSQIGLAGFFYFENDFVIYNVKSLTKKESQTSPPIEIKVHNKPIKGIIYYNIGNDLDVLPDCGENFASSSAYLFTAKKECFNLISVDRTNNDYKLIEDPELPEDPKVNGFFILSKTSSFIVRLQCQEDQIKPSFNFEGTTLVIKSADSCGSEDILGKFIATNRYAFSAIVICFGLILLIFGGNKWDLILGISGFFLGLSFVFFFFYVVVDFKYNTTSFMVIIILALVIGSLVSYLSYHSTTISYIGLGFPSGYFLAKVFLTVLKITLADVV